MTSKTIKVVAFKYVGGYGGGLQFLEFASIPTHAVLTEILDKNWESLGLFRLPEDFLEKLRKSKTTVKSLTGKKASVRTWEEFSYE